MNNISAQKSEELTFLEIYKKGKEILIYLKSKWLIISFFGLIGGVSGFYYAYKQPLKYSAKLTFVVEESKSGGLSSLGGLASLAGQFGVDMGGNGGGILSGENIIQYFKSPTLAREVLLSKFNEKSNISFVDLYIKKYELDEIWKKLSVKKISFPILDSGTVYSRLQDSLLAEITNDILKTKFIITKTDKKTSFIDVIVTMKDESLAKFYCENIVEKAISRYVSVKTSRQKSNVNKLQSRADSLALLLGQKTYLGASLQNSSQIMDINPLYKTKQSVAIETTVRDKSLIATIFASVIQNLEISKFALSQETPVIQILDKPQYPLFVTKFSKAKTAIIFAFVSVIICSLILIIRSPLNFMKLS